jgi:hypothetical protein
MAMSTTIDIKGIDKKALMRAMWKRSQTATFFMFYTSVPAPDLDDEALTEATTRYVDYLCGRCIKTDISKDTANSYLYDRDMGQGALREIVDKLRDQKK